MKHIRSCATYRTACAVCNCWLAFRDAPSLLEYLKASIGRRMTPEESFEQRVSFAFSTQGGMTKDQVRAILLKREGC